MLAGYQQDFIKFALDSKVLSFGAFTLKSGRVSPYFFNAGAFNSGIALARLSGFYADALTASGFSCDLIFGPAYKGIPLACSTAVALSVRHGKDMAFAYNRKETKGHGEGGVFVGAPIAGDVVIIDDVITAGTAIREIMALLAPTGARVSGILVAIDRQERGRGELSAIGEVEAEYGVSVSSIVKLDDLIEYLSLTGDLEPELRSMQDYRAEYGAPY